MDPLAELIGRSPKIAALREQIRALLAGEATTHRLPPLLITGETGTGKSLLARVIHQVSSRSAAQFVELNGAAIPEHLLESELFGYERGAFTDARQSKQGLLQVAHHGTLFLDEVGLLPPSLQAKLLRVLEDDRVRRLGATRSEPVDVCIISATNEDLQAAVRARRFREDLYHRLAVITLSLPPLRELGADIDLLAAHALARSCAKYSVPLKQLSAAAQATLRVYRWPGNVRELNSVIERAVLLCPAAVIPADVLALEASPEMGGREAPGAVDLAEAERQRLSGVLAQTEWNISRTAAILGITRNTVRARIAKYGLRPAGSNERMAEGSAPESSGAAATEFDELPLDRPTGESETEPADREAEPESPEDRVEAVAAVEVSSLPGAQAAAPFGSETTAPSRIDLARGRPSIAVLPFHVHGETETKSYFGDGVVEDIIGALASLRELLVISRTSTLRYRGTGVDVRVVGREMGVTYALSGSVRRAGDRMRVSAELAETVRGAVVWASHFDGVSDDLFALQDQIATRVVSIIAPQVRDAELQRALRKRPESMEAYDCVLRGMAQLYQLNAEDFAEARTWLQKAISLDPAYAAPYALLAAWHNLRVQQGWSPDPAIDYAEVMRMATAALGRDSFDATALALCGHAKSMLRYEFDEAIAMFNRAIESNPSSYIAWTRSSPTYSYIGDPREAIRRAQQGLALSPVDPHVFFPHTSLGIGFYVAGEYEEGARWGRKAREENSRYTGNLRFLAANLAASGQIDEAHETGRALLTLEPGFQVGSFVDRYPIRDPERQQRLARHLRLAGLPG